jgi:GNAT superfamily N-acetyltransferase
MMAAMVVRAMEAGDAEDVARLCGQLDYPSTAEQVAGRFSRITASQSDDAIFVACVDGRAVGWIHLLMRALLETEPYVEVGGLVVDEGLRGHGIGRALMNRAEAWARERGCARVRLRSNVRRTGAHEFYRALGYSVLKTQYAFEKALGG